MDVLILLLYLLVCSVWVRGQESLTLILGFRVKVKVIDLLPLLRRGPSASVEVIVLVETRSSLPIDEASGSLLLRLLIALVVTVRGLLQCPLLFRALQVLVEVFALLAQLVLHDFEDVSMGYGGLPLHVLIETIPLRVVALQVVEQLFCKFVIREEVLGSELHVDSIVKHGPLDLLALLLCEPLPQALRYRRHFLLCF